MRTKKFSLLLLLAALSLCQTARAYYDPTAGRFISFDPVAPPIGSMDGYSFANGDPINQFDADGRFGKGIYSGLTDSPVPGNASSAFMAGYYGGGVTAGFNEGWQGGQQIVANTFTFGGMDAIGLTDSSQYQGGAYTGSRILATVGRESLITAATFGTAQLARGGSQGALYTYQGLQTVNAARSGYQVGTGIDQVANGNNWGYLNIAGGGLGLAGGLGTAAYFSELNALGGNVGKMGRPLDWSIVSSAGETRAAHVVAQHGSLNLQKPVQGVFYGNPVTTLDNAWSIAQQQGIKPITSGGVDIYVIPRANSGFAGGYLGQGQNLNTVTILTQPSTPKIITGFPGNGTPLPKP